MIDVLLMDELVPLICSIAGDVFVFQQDNAPAHRASDTDELLFCETSRSLILTCGQWPAYSADLNPTDRVCGTMQRQ